jgi:hypothetical protein
LTIYYNGDNIKDDKICSACSKCGGDEIFTHLLFGKLLSEETMVGIDVGER